MRHTPGPWVVGKGEDEFTHTIEADVGPVAFNVENYDANLIAAAPDLLEALIFCLEFLEANDDDEDDVVKRIKKARTTIAKATGEQV